MPRRTPAVLLAALAVVAVMALIGWRAGWPPVLFGARPASSAGSSPRASALRAVSPGSQAPTSAAPSSASPASPATTATSPSSPTSPASTPSGVTSSAVTGPLGPAATVRGYFAAISRKAYRTAWRLGGRNTSASYQAFVNGLNGTAEDAVTIISVNGDLVSAQLAARQDDGSIKTYQGTYTVSGGVIVSSNVQQTS
ncbi:MAG: hypothetical protein ABSB01_21095 [Streptosporangiaceae bacterium]